MPKVAAMDKQEHLARENGLFADVIRDMIRGGSFNLSRLPNALSKAINQQVWENLFIGQTGSFVSHKSMTEWIESHPPEGLGSKVDIVRSLIKDDPEVLIKFNQYALPTDKREGNGDSTRFEPSYSNSHHFDGNWVKDRSGEIKEGRNRAITRSPQFIQQLYHQGLIGQTEAVKLGPRLNNRKPTEQQLGAKERAFEVAAGLEQWVHQNPPPEDKAKKPAYKRKVNSYVRQQMDIVKPVSVSWAEDAEPEDIAGKLFERVDKDRLLQVVAILNEALCCDGGEEE